MQNKKTYTDFIISELNKGNVKYNDVCLLFCSKFDLTKQSFNKYWKIANTEHIEQREAINKEKLSTIIQIEKEAVKRDIMDLMEAKEILSKIGRGMGRSMNGQVFYPSDNERRGAIDLLSKINGWNAPQKQDVNITETKLPKWMMDEEE
jgi:hypothetical protein